MSLGSENELQLLIAKLGMLSSDQLHSRLESYQALTKPDFKPRPPRVKGGGRRYLILNSDNRSVSGEADLDLAEFKADNYGGRKILDMDRLPAYYRRILGNALRANLGSTKAQMPDVPLPPSPKTVKPFDPDQALNRLLDDVRKEVLHLAAAGSIPRDQAEDITHAASELARIGGWDLASEFLFEATRLYLTSVLDQVDQSVEHFDNAEDASEYATLMNQSPDGMIFDGKGKPTGRYRYKVINPQE